MVSAHVHDSCDDLPPHCRPAHAQSLQPQGLSSSIVPKSSELSNGRRPTSQANGFAQVTGKSSQGGEPRRGGVSDSKGSKGKPASGAGVGSSSQQPSSQASPSWRSSQASQSGAGAGGGDAHRPSSGTKGLNPSAKAPSAGKHSGPGAGGDKPATPPTPGDNGVKPTFGTDRSSALPTSRGTAVKGSGEVAAPAGKPASHAPGPPRDSSANGSKGHDSRKASSTKEGLKGRSSSSPDEKSGGRKDGGEKASERSRDVKKVKEKAKEGEKEKAKPKDLEKEKAKAKETDKDKAKPKEGEKEKAKAKDGEKDKRRFKEGEREKEKPKEGEKEKAKPKQVEQERVKEGSKGASTERERAKEKEKAKEKEGKVATKDKDAEKDKDRGSSKDSRTSKDRVKDDSQGKPRISNGETMRTAAAKDGGSKVEGIKGDGAAKKSEKKEKKPEKKTDRKSSTKRAHRSESSSRSCSRSRSSSRDKSSRHKRLRSSKEKDKGRKSSKRGRSSSRSPGPRKRPVTRSRSLSPRAQLRLPDGPRGVDRRMHRGGSGRFGRFDMRGVVLDGAGRLWEGALLAGMDGPVWAARRSRGYSRGRSPPYVRVRSPPGGFEAAAGPTGRSGFPAAMSGPWEAAPTLLTAGSSRTLSGPVRSVIFPDGPVVKMWQAPAPPPHEEGSAHAGEGGDWGVSKGWDNLLPGQGPLPDLPVGYGVASSALPPPPPQPASQPSVQLSAPLDPRVSDAGTPRFASPTGTTPANALPAPDSPEHLGATGEAPATSLGSTAVSGHLGLDTGGIDPQFFETEVNAAVEAGLEKLLGVTHPDDRCWYYIDPHEVTQGPCSIAQFREWMRGMRSDLKWREPYEEFLRVTVWKPHGMDYRVRLATLLHVHRRRSPSPVPHSPVSPPPLEVSAVQ